MRNPKFSKWFFTIAGGYLLFCVPFVCSTWSDSLTEICRVSYLPAAVVCLLASCHFLWATRGSPFDRQRKAALVAACLSGMCLVLVGFIVLSFDMSAMD